MKFYKEEVMYKRKVSKIKWTEVAKPTFSFVVGESSIHNERDCPLSREGFMPKRTDIMLEKLLHPTMKLYYNVLTQPYSLRKFPSPNYFVLGNCPSVNNEWSLIKRLTKKKSGACFFILREKRN